MQAASWPRQYVRPLSPAPRPPEALWAKFAAIQRVGESVYIFADAGGFRYDAAAGTWSKVAALSEVLVMPACVEDAGRIHILGGMVVDGGDRASVRTYDLGTNRWSSP